ncbi:Omp28-related outer membrane protein [Flavobacterium croceum]|jgi:hypothetical protein|uniref:Outer membrane protein Omp28 n=1 Tax=Flavobacterium croceum DSM 17960 TaxID=1121886 RepID=A0A2S4NC60_9FLAO|nr:Omp28-related outer membrane protein [Flavobacterium croceum]POS03023.1 outer membrane protein Omp28 [Flavobacterium croceum DSM 17960]
MNKSYFFGLFFIFMALFSCNAPNVIENIPSDSETAPPISGYFKKRVLIEDYTGTWCGNCTRVAYAIDQVFTKTDKAVSVAIHNGNDPYHFAGIQPLKELILPNSDLELPQSRLNRTIVWTSPEPSNVQQALDLTGNNSGLGLALNSTVTNGNINLDVTIKFAQNYSNLKLVVYLLEDHLIYMQRNYTSYYNGVNPIPNFEHNHVLRQSVTNILGDPLLGSFTTGTSVTKSFSFPVPANVSNPENISFAAFVVNENNVVVNVRNAHKGESQSFEQNP